MKKILLKSLLGLAFIPFAGFAQITVNMSNGSTTTCDANFYDNGGPGLNYSNGQNLTHTFNGAGGGSPVLTFTSFSLESGWDYMRIYDGPTTGSPLLGVFSGTALPGPFTASGSSLTINFTSDGSVTRPGWIATVGCYFNFLNVTAGDTLIPLCYGDSIVLDPIYSGGTPPYTYAWSTGETTPSITGVAGSYSVTVTDNVGDMDTADIAVVNPDSIDAIGTIVTPLVCKYDDSEIFIDGSGGTALTEAYVMDTSSANYNWDSSGNCTVVPLPGSSVVSGVLDIGFDFEFYGNTYNQFQIARNGYIGFGGNLDDGCCSGEPVPHFSAFEPDNAIFAAWFDVDNDQGISYCLSGEAPFRTLIVNFIGLGDGTTDDNYTGQILLHETTNCIEIQTDYMQYQGLYNQFDDCTQGITNDGSTLGQAYPGRNSSGGWEADSSYVRFCPVDSTGLAYDWSNGHTGSTAYGLEPGTYMVTVSDLYGCSTVETVVLDPAVSNLTLDPIISDISCFGFNDGMIESNQTGGISPIIYSWNSGQSSADISSLSAGSYDIVATDALGCSDSVISMSVLEPALLFSSVYLNEPTQCPEDENGTIGIVMGGGVAPYDVLWSNGQIGPLATNLPAGVYQAQVTDASGCVSFETSSVLAEFNSPSVNLGGIVTQPNGAAATLDAGPHSAYLWSNGATSQTVQVTTTGNYWVEVFNSNGCMASDTVYVEIWPTGINDIADDAQFAIYPNPASSNLMVTLAGDENLTDVRVSIVNVQGQIVMEKMLTSISASEQVELDVQNIAPGMYNLSIQSETFNAVSSFVKQ